MPTGQDAGTFMSRRFGSKKSVPHGSLRYTQILLRADDRPDCSFVIRGHSDELHASVVRLHTHHRCLELELSRLRAAMPGNPDGEADLHARRTWQLAVEPCTQN
jgi:hypothetical protein